MTRLKVIGEYGPIPVDVLENNNSAINSHLSVDCISIKLHVLNDTKCQSIAIIDVISTKKDLK